MKKLIIANWKMNGSLTKINQDLNSYLTNEITNQENVVIAPPTLFSILAMDKIIKGNAKLKLAAQDVSVFDGFGAYTGEISGAMLKDIGINYAIIGHSERRLNFLEDDVSLAKKLTNAFKNQIQPIFCIGESLEIRKNGHYAEFLAQQLGCLKLVTSPIDKIVIAYEPIWSIGSGLIPELKEIEETMVLIHKFMQNNLPHARISTLYGGSVSAKNASNVLNTHLVDGVLVGGASLNVSDFSAICGSC